MSKLYIPTYHAKSVYDIPISFYKENGIKTLFVDLDNTLDSYRRATPSERAIALKERLAKEDIEMIIVSNNRPKRVGLYANSLGVRFVPSIGKPFARGINKAIVLFNLDKNTILMVGDQTFTDIASANRAHLKSVLTDKIVKEDQPTTHFNRLFDRPIRHWLRRKHLLREIEG